MEWSALKYHDSIIMTCHDMSMSCYNNIYFVIKVALFRFRFRFVFVLFCSTHYMSVLYGGDYKIYIYHMRNPIIDVDFDIVSTIL